MSPIPNQQLMQKRVPSGVSGFLPKYLFFVSSMFLLTGVAKVHNVDILKSTSVGTRLSAKYYEPVFYDHSNLINQHKRVKREMRSDDYERTGYQDNSITFPIESKNKKFLLKLGVDKSVFHPEALIENSDSKISYDTSRVLTGYLDGDPESSVHGVISKEGYFDGHISTTEDTYYVEPSNRYLDLPNQSQGVLYRSEDVDPPQQTPFCASHELHLKRKELLMLNKSSADDYHKNKFSFHSRKKRYAVDPKKKTCMLFLQADLLFYQHFGSEEACIDVMTRHIQRVNEIYRSTDFDLDGKPDDISFMIKRVKVHTSNQSLSPPFRYEGEFQVIKFLELFSEGDYDSFCLAYMFTYRDFEGGTLGLAWTGDLKNAGGVCERKGHFRGGLKSLNTGIITLLNYGKFVLPPVSHVTLAHEIGHNFGSPHDPEGEKQCTPGGKEGNYIMYARATAGDQKNNNKFSPCSLKSILPVLNFKARDMHGCFVEPKGAICGNREVEEGEECDCGWEDDCTESCCFPMRLRPVQFEPSCKLRPTKVCSPSQGPCCTGNCTLKYGEKCRDDNGCRDSAFCDGVIPVCPLSRHKPNKTVCNDESVCFMGECTGSICLAYGLEVCQCNAESSTKSCELCCKLPGEGSPCLSSFQWNHAPLDVPDLYSKPGSPCKNYTGYCDPYHTCREVDPSGPLSILRNLLLADEGLTAIASWIDHHWYAVVSLVVLLLVAMILAAKFCGKRAQARLRKITILHSNVEAIQIQRSYLDEQGEHVIHPLAVRKKIPFKKKVRERRPKKRVARDEKASSSTAVTNSTSVANQKNRKRTTKPKKIMTTPKSSASTSSQTVHKKASTAEPVPSTSASLPNENIPPKSIETDIISDSHNISNSIDASCKANIGQSGVIDHKLKTAVVPSVHAKRSKRRGKNTSTHHGHSSKETYRKSAQKAGNDNETRKASSSKPSTSKRNVRDKEGSAATGPKTFHVIYKPPFSVTIQTRQQPTSDETPAKLEKSSRVAKSHNTGSKPSSYSTGSFLQRRKGNLKRQSSKYNSELKVLIPPQQMNEECLTSSTLQSPSK